MTHMNDLKKLRADRLAEHSSISRWCLETGGLSVVAEVSGLMHFSSQHTRLFVNGQKYTYQT